MARAAADGLAPGGRALHGAQHVPHRRLVGRTAQAISSRRATAGLEKSGALELEQHLLEISLGDPLARGDLLDRLKPFPVVQRQVQQGLDGVFSLRGDPHARPCSISLARSFAKYVMMMSAPARRIPVSASTMTRSSSIQPSCPAARIIAYSPETE